MNTHFLPAEDVFEQENTTRVDGTSQEAFIDEFEAQTWALSSTTFKSRSKRSKPLDDAAPTLNKASMQQLHSNTRTLWHHIEGSSHKVQVRRTSDGSIHLPADRNASPFQTPVKRKTYQDRPSVSIDALLFGGSSALQTTTGEYFSPSDTDPSVTPDVIVTLRVEPRKRERRQVRSVHLDTLLACLIQDLQSGHTPNREAMHLYLQLPPYLPLRGDNIHHGWNTEIDSTAQLIQRIKDFYVETPYTIYFHYLTMSATLESSPPYRWQNTLDSIALDPAAPFSVFQQPLKWAFFQTVHYIQLAQSDHWKDIIVQRLCSFWRPKEPTDIPDLIIKYLNVKSTGSSYTEFLNTGNFKHHLWFCFPITLGSTTPGYRMASVMSAIWCLALEEDNFLDQPVPNFWPALYQPTLAAVEAIAESELLNTRASVCAMIRWKLLQCLPFRGDIKVYPFKNSMLPTETAICVPPEFLDTEFPLDCGQWAFNTFELETVLNNRILEAGIAVITEFLLVFHPDFIPYEPEKTLMSICSNICPPRSAIHKSHQTQFANGLRRVVDSEHPEIIAELLEVIMTSGVFYAYFRAGLPQVSTVEPAFSFNGDAWLQDSAGWGARVDPSDFTRSRSFAPRCVIYGAGLANFSSDTARKCSSIPSLCIRNYPECTLCVHS
ncbi:hypothetical protein C8F04DRAFT_1349643 [Mycena alexandri]|uniref:Uncharacterized protein n=1 Tax=Mycena alexandri TaxID=1745969 RepID=A0AAD6X4A8_9AGAR|nr:hypothetical protein C8F04DRAFT_1349643 [Mycena alexandri]